MYRVSVLAGSSLPYFDVSVTCEGYEITRTLRVMGIDGGMESPIYLKVYPKDLNAAKPILYRDTMQVVDNGFEWPAKTDEGHLIEGDYVLVLTEVRESQSTTEGEIEPIPFTWVPGVGTQDEGHWELLDEDSPAYSEAMGTMLSDVVRLPDMPVTVGAYYGFFENLSAQTAFINRLFARQIHIIGDGVIYGGDYNADGSRIENGPNNGRGFHLRASDGLLQATKAMLYDVDIISIDANQKTVLRTYRSEDTDSFSYDFNVTPTCFKLSSNRLNINGEYAYYESWEYESPYGQVLKSTTTLPDMSRGGYGGSQELKFIVPQACKVVLLLDGGVTYRTDSTSYLNFDISVNGTLTEEYDLNATQLAENPTWNGYELLAPLVVAANTEIKINRYHNLVEGTTSFTLCVIFSSDLSNAFASVSSPSLAWVVGNDDVDTTMGLGYWRTVTMRKVIAASASTYIAIGSANVPGVDVQYAPYVTGIIAGLSSNMESGKTYTATSTSTMVWNGMTKNVLQVSRSGSTFAFLFTDGSSAIVSDTHTACEIHISVESQPSYIDVYRLMITDPNGSIGTTNERVPAIYADYLYGRLPLSNFAEMGKRSVTTTRPAVTISSYRASGSTSSLPVRVTNAQTGVLSVTSVEYRLSSDGFVDLGLDISFDDDTYSYLDLPFDFMQYHYNVQISAFRSNMLPDGNGNPPGMGGTGKDAQANATMYSWTTPSGSAHQWTRFIVFNDYEEASGYLRVSGYIKQDMFDDIVSHSGDLTFLFDI